jgi:acetyltransferase-like isoleucine patch superfamily enzyme
MPHPERKRGDRVRRAGRIAWTILTGLVVESVVLGLAVLPAALLWQVALDPFAGAARLALGALLVVPAYIVFALCLMTFSALAMRLTGWRTPAHAALRIADLEWPLLAWARYLASAHVVRTLAGAMFRATPVWTYYHRLNGARIGRRVYINSLTVMDDNLLELGDGVVIGEAAHVSGHTVEGGLVKTDVVRLGPGVTIGVGSVVGIGVAIGAGAQVGALSLVPKHRVIEPGAVYVGVPAHRLSGPRSLHIDLPAELPVQHGTTSSGETR